MSPEFVAVLGRATKGDRGIVGTADALLSVEYPTLHTLSIIALYVPIVELYLRTSASSSWFRCVALHSIVYWPSA